MVEFFDQNPISQLGIIAAKNGRATKVSELNGKGGGYREERKKSLISTSSPLPYVCVGNSRVPCRALEGLKECSGDLSLQNSLQMAMRGLQYVDVYAQLVCCPPLFILTTTQRCGFMLVVTLYQFNTL